MQQHASSDPPQPINFRVFLSSPGDVPKERAAARAILERIPRSPLLRGRVTLDVVSWDDPDSPVPMVANLSPQDAVNRGLPLPSQCHLTVVIFGERFGTPLLKPRRPDGRQYLSGTEWEYENALGAGRDVLIYRRSIAAEQGPVQSRTPEETHQQRLVDQFFDRMKAPDGSLRQGYTSYASLEAFQNRLKLDVESLIGRLMQLGPIRDPLSASETGNGTSAAPDDNEPAPAHEKPATRKRVSTGVSRSLAWLAIAALIAIAAVLYVRRDDGGSAGEPPPRQPPSVPAVVPAVASVPNTTSVQLLAIGALRGSLEARTYATGPGGQAEVGGIDYLAAHLRRDEATNPNTVIVGTGGLVGSGSPLSWRFHNEPTIESLNLMGVGVSAIARAEFSLGEKELERIVAGGCHPTDGCQDGDEFDGARFAYLSANVVKTGAPNPPFRASDIRKIGGTTVGFIGVTSSDTPSVVSPRQIDGLVFLDEVSSANEQAERLRSQGAKTIVLLLDSYGRQEVQVGTEDLNGCRDLTGGVTTVLKSLSPLIRIVISGNGFYNCQIDGRLVVGAGTYGQAYSRIQLAINQDGEVVSASATNRIVSHDISPDADQRRLLEKYKTLAKPLANRVIGQVRADITREASPAGESAIGDVVTDAILATARVPDRGGAQIAFYNPAGIRADISSRGRMARMRPGAVTYDELLSVLPFGNTVTVLTMTGEMIGRVLEQQFVAPRSRPIVLQVSAGFAYRYDLRKPEGQRVERTSMALNGRVIAPSDTVRVAVPEFLAAGGDGFSIFQEGTSATNGNVDLDCLISYLETQPLLSPPDRDRITRNDSSGITDTSTR